VVCRWDELVGISLLNEKIGWVQLEECDQNGCCEWEGFVGC